MGAERAEVRTPDRAAGDALAALDAAPRLSEVSEAHRSRIRGFLAERGAVALTRQCVEGHLTASCLLFDTERARVLLHHHRKLGLWLQFGGHCDGEGDLSAVALRETREESGIDPVWISPTAVDFDVHEIPARGASGGRPAEPAHLHLDVRFVAVAGQGARPEISDESLDLGWFTPEEARALGLDASLERLLDVGLALVRGQAVERDQGAGRG